MRVHIDIEDGPILHVRSIGSTPGGAEVMDAIADGLVAPPVPIPAGVRAWARVAADSGKTLCRREIVPADG